MQVLRERRTLLAKRGGTTEYDNGPARILAKAVFFERRSKCYTQWFLSIGGYRKWVESNQNRSGLVK